MQRTKEAELGHGAGPPGYLGCHWREKNSSGGPTAALIFQLQCPLILREYHQAGVSSITMTWLLSVSTSFTAFPADSFSLLLSPLPPAFAASSLWPLPLMPSYCQLPSLCPTTSSTMGPVGSACDHNKAVMSDPLLAITQAMGGCHGIGGQFLA